MRCIISRKPTGPGLIIFLLIPMTYIRTYMQFFLTFSSPLKRPCTGERKTNSLKKSLFIVQTGNTYTYNSMHIQMVKPEKWLKVIMMLYPPGQRRCLLPMTPCMPAVGHAGAFYYMYHTLCSPDWRTLIIVCWQFSPQPHPLQQQASPKQEMTRDWSLQYLQFLTNWKTSYIVPGLTL